MSALQYHLATKHFFNRFARSLGYLDWATQPDPFRRYPGAPVIPLSRDALAGERRYASLYESSGPASPIDDRAIAEFLRCSMGLSAWKQYRETRWALRVNPSSGNLHPTEAYLLRQGDLWRETWKYGERAFRYCQHDTGHAIAAMRLAASLLGWKLSLLPRWSDSSLSTLLGLDRDGDYEGAEREEAECLAVVTSGDISPWLAADPLPLADAARAATWQGRANRLSRDRVEWPIIDEVARVTRYPGGPSSIRNGPTPGSQSRPTPNSQEALAREVILKRRSAVAFDAQSGLSRDCFLSMLARLRPGPSTAPGASAPPWDAIDWPPHVHLILFVHRVEGLTPGVYAYLRDPGVLEEWRAAMRREFLWERMNANDPNDSNDPNDPNDPNDLFLLFPSDVMWTANRLSCDQDIAADGFFSLGMIARMESLKERGEWFYRRLFWECGMIGQVLYLEAEAAGARGTGIGCFYDDPVHELLALSDERWQSLYHFSMGVPVEDGRLTTEPGYPWEKEK